MTVLTRLFAVFLDILLKVLLVIVDDLIEGSAAFEEHPHIHIRTRVSPCLSLGIKHKGDTFLTTCSHIRNPSLRDSEFEDLGADRHERDAIGVYASNRNWKTIAFWIEFIAYDLTSSA